MFFYAGTERYLLRRRVSPIPIRILTPVFSLSDSSLTLRKRARQSLRGSARTASTRLQEHYFASLNFLRADESFGNHHVQAGGLFQGRTTGVIEEPATVGRSEFSVSLRDI